MSNELDALRTELKGYSIELVDKFRAAIEVRFEKQENQQEIIDRQLATLTLAYAEVAALVQAMLSLLVNENDPEKIKEFQTHIKESRQTMMDNLSHATQQAQHSTDKFVAVSPDATGEPSNNS